MKQIKVSLNLNNKNCDKAVNGKAVNMTMFTKKIGNRYYFNIDGKEVEIKESWIKNLKMVDDEIARVSYVPQTEEAKKIQALGLDWDLRDVDRLVRLFSKDAEDSMDKLVLAEAKRNSEMAWLALQDALKA